MPTTNQRGGGSSGRVAGARQPCERIAPFGSRSAAAGRARRCVRGTAGAGSSGSRAAKAPPLHRTMSRSSTRDAPALAALAPAELVLDALEQREQGLGRVERRCRHGRGIGIAPDRGSDRVGFDVGATGRPSGPDLPAARAPRRAPRADGPCRWWPSVRAERDQVAPSAIGQLRCPRRSVRRAAAAGRGRSPSSRGACGQAARSSVGDQDTCFLAAVLGTR
jgi:hypothetical protein